MSETYTAECHRQKAPGPYNRARAVLLCACILWLGNVSPLHAQTPNQDLFQAVELNDVDAVEAAIAAGADLGAKNDKGMTPADVAVDLGHFRIAHTLLAKRTAAMASAPRVTEKGKQALANSTKRVAAPVAPKPPAAPDPRISELSVPRKPTPAESNITVPVPGVPETAPKSLIPAADTASPAKPDTRQPSAKPAIEPRPDDELAGTTPPVEKPAMAPNKESADGDGVFSSIWGGIKSAVTLGGLIGGDDATMQNEATTNTNTGREMTSPANRFTYGQSAPSESAAGRLVDRMKNTVGSDDKKENAFGLPVAPVVPTVVPPGLPALEAPQVETAERQPPMATPEIITPPAGMPSSDVVIPGLVPPVGNESAAVPMAAPNIETPSELPGLATPELPDSGVTGLPPGLEMPGVAAPPAPAPAASAGAIPGLPPGLDLPGLDAPTSEVPGIIPPPSSSAQDMPALPPGLEPLPGSGSDQLRRPGGLIQPEDPSVLPPPTSASLREQLRRIDKVLNRDPVQQRNTYGAPRGTAPNPSASTRQLTEKRAPVGVVTPETPPNPMMEVPRGLEPRQRPAPASDRADPGDILRNARESDAVLREREKFTRQPAPKGGSAIEAPVHEASKHALRPKAPVITERLEPSTRMFDRMKNLGKNAYENDDIHGLPITRPPVKGAPTIPKDVDVAALPDPKAEKTDGKIYALARFFRGDQEEEQGMLPPPAEVNSEPLPHVIDNLIPENDPARGRVVDDRLLDLKGVENRPPAGTGQPGADATRNTRLNENFLDKLTTVLGPTTPQAPRAIGTPEPEAGRIGLGDLDVPKDQMVPPSRPAIPDPWTMTIQKSEGKGQSKTLGVSAISPEDGSEIQTEKGVVSQMVGRIRQLLSDPEQASNRNTKIDTLDEAERQSTAEQLLSDALRNGAPTALPDQTQWPVTEVDAGNATPGVPPKPRAGALTRTSLQDVVLSMGESVTLENTLPPQQEGVDPLNACVKKNRGTTLFCIEPIDWPADLRSAFVIPTILYTGPMAITRYDQGTPSRLHALFSSEDFEKIIAYYQARYGEPTEIFKRSVAPLAQPRMDNPTVSWRSRDSKTNVITVLEIRKFDDTRGGFPDTNRGAAMLYHFNAPEIFPQVSSHELMRLRRTR